MASSSSFTTKLGLWLAILALVGALSFLFASLDDALQRDANRLVADHFYFVNGKPAWYDLTLEGQWTAALQQVEQRKQPMRNKRQWKHQDTRGRLRKGTIRDVFPR